MQELTDLLLGHPYVATGTALAATRLLRELQIRVNLGLESYTIKQRGKEYPRSPQLNSGYDHLDPDKPQNVYALVTIDGPESHFAEAFEETLAPGHVYVLNSTGERRDSFPVWKKRTCEATFHKGTPEKLREVSEEIASKLQNPYDVVIVASHTHSNRMLTKTGIPGVRYITSRLHLGPLVFGAGNGDITLNEFLQATEPLEKAQVVHFYDTCFGGSHAKETALKTNRTAVAPNASGQSLRFSDCGGGNSLIRSPFMSGVLEGYLQQGLSLEASFLQSLGRTERSLDFYMGILPFYNRHTPVLYYNNWRPSENSVSLK